MENGNATVRFWGHILRGVRFYPKKEEQETQVEDFRMLMEGEGERE